MTLSHRTWKNRSSRPGVGVVACLLLAAGINGPARHASAAPPAPGVAPSAPSVPATQPSSRPAPDAEAGRPMELIIRDLNAAAREVNQYVSGVAVLFDAEKRKAAAPKALPVMKRMAGLIDEIVAT